MDAQRRWPSVSPTAAPFAQRCGYSSITNTAAPPLPHDAPHETTLLSLCEALSEATAEGPATESQVAADAPSAVAASETPMPATAADVAAPFGRREVRKPPSAERRAAAVLALANVDVLLAQAAAASASAVGGVAATQAGHKAARELARPGMVGIVLAAAAGAADRFSLRRSTTNCDPGSGNDKSNTATTRRSSFDRAPADAMPSQRGAGWWSPDAATALAAALAAEAPRVPAGREAASLLCDAGRCGGVGRRDTLERLAARAVQSKASSAVGLRERRLPASLRRGADDNDGENYGDDAEGGDDTDAAATEGAADIENGESPQWAPVRGSGSIVHVAHHVSLCVRRAGIRPPPLEAFLRPLAFRTKTTTRGDGDAAAAGNSGRGSALTAAQAVKLLAALQRLGTPRRNTDAAAAAARRVASLAPIEAAAVVGPGEAVLLLRAATALAGCGATTLASAALAHCAKCAPRMSPRDVGDACAALCDFHSGRGAGAAATGGAGDAATDAERSARAREVRRLLPSLVARAEALRGAFSVRESIAVLKCLDAYGVRHGVLFASLAAAAGGSPFDRAVAGTSRGEAEKLRQAPRRARTGRRG